MAKLLSLLFEVTALFDMQTRTELVMLQKTMVVVGGVARPPAPKLHMWATSDPVVREWITRHLAPAGRLEQAAAEPTLSDRPAAKLPDLVTRAERVLARLDPPELAGAIFARRPAHR